MAQSKQEIQQILAQAGSEPRHRFGQNFMIDQNLVRIIADSGEIAAGDLIIEVGPGTGTLTDEILSRGAELIAVEIDRDLARVLREGYADNSRFRLIQGDALESKHALNAEVLEAISGKKREGGRVKLIANLPYNVASPLVIEMLIAGVDLLAFTVQKEVADRLRAKEDSEAYGPLSVMAQMLSKVELLRTLPPQAFWPPPKIESSLVRMRREDRLGQKAGEFGTFVQMLFSFRRKTLKKALTQGGFDAAKMLGATGIDGTVRPEVLAPEMVLKLFEAR